MQQGALFRPQTNEANGPWHQRHYDLKERDVRQVLGYTKQNDMKEKYTPNPEDYTFTCKKCGWKSKAGDINFFFFIEELDLPKLDNHICK